MKFGSEKEMADQKNESSSSFSTISSPTLDVSPDKVPNSKQNGLKIAEFSSKLILKGEPFIIKINFTCASFKSESKSILTVNTGGYSPLEIVVVKKCKVAINGKQYP